MRSTLGNQEDQRDVGAEPVAQALHGLHGGGRWHSHALSCTSWRSAPRVGSSFPLPMDMAVHMTSARGKQHVDVLQMGHEHHQPGPATWSPALNTMGTEPTAADREDAVPKENFCLPMLYYLVAGCSWASGFLLALAAGIPSVTR